MADAELFVDGDLNVVDVVAVPDRLEHAVGKAQHQDVLDGFLAEIMIDPVNLMLFDEPQEFAVQRSCRGKVGPERFLDHQPPPCAVLGQHAGTGEFVADRQERTWRRRQVEQAVAAGFPHGLEFVELFAHRVERGWIPGIGLDGGDARKQALGDGVVHGAGGELVQALHQAVAQFAARHALAGNADDAVVLRQQIGRREIIEGRDHQPMREIAGDAENDEGAGIGFLLRQSADRHGIYAFEPGFFGGSLWPPKPARMAERIFSANVWSLRERKRA